MNLTLLFAAFMLLVVVMVVFGIRAALAARRVAMPTANESPRIALAPAGARP